jgi:hypothetical protein
MSSSNKNNQKSQNTNKKIEISSQTREKAEQAKA